MVSTDHCPFCFNEQPYGMKHSKQQGADDFSKIPNGAPGVETRMPLIFEGAVHKHGMSINRFVEITATAPAKLFGLFPRKGTIAVGTDGDIVLFDPDEQWTIRAAEQHTRSDYTLFEGRSGERPGEKSVSARSVHRRRADVAGPRRDGRVPEARRIREDLGPACVTRPPRE